MGASQLTYEEQKEQNLINKKTISNLKKLPSDVSDLFFEKSMEDTFFLDNVDFIHEEVAKKLYYAYMIGAALGIEIAVNKKQKPGSKKSS